MPAAFWFRWALECRKVQGVPLESANGPLLDLPDACRLPAPALLEGKSAPVEVRACWNAAGIGFAFSGEFENKRPDGRAVKVQVWLDTRDARDNHRATRFCHRFEITLSTIDPAAPTTSVEEREIARALGSPARAPADSIRTSGTLAGSRWRIEAFFNAAALTGFDPETNRRLGWNYMATILGEESKTFGIGREFPIGEDPSLWATLELIETEAGASLAPVASTARKPKRPRKSKPAP